NRSHGRGVTESHAYGMREIVQLICTVGHAHCRIRRARGPPRIQQLDHRIRQRRAEGNAAQPAVDVAAVIKQSAAQRCAKIRKTHRKSKFLIKYQERLSSYRETGARVTRTGLVQRKATQRGAAAREEALRQRDDRWG